MRHDCHSSCDQPDQGKPQRFAFGDWRLLIRQGLMWLPLVVLMILIPVVSPNFQIDSPRRTGPFAGDFLQEWIGGSIVLQGPPKRLYDAELSRSLQHDASVVGFEFDTDRYLPMVYPPFYYLLVSPLAALPYLQAAWVWYVAMCGITLVAIRLTANLVGGRIGTWLPLAAAGFAPLLLNLNGGQKGAVCWLIVAGSLWALQHRKEFVAGVILGLLLFKPQLAVGLIGIAIMQREWRFLAGVTMSAVAAGMLSLAVGVESCVDFVRFASQASDFVRNQGYDLVGSHSWYGFANLLFGPGVAAKLLTLGLLIGMSLWLLLGWNSPTVRPATRDSKQSTTPINEAERLLISQRFSATLLLSLVASPHLMTYDLTMLLLPLAVASQTAASLSTSLNKRQRRRTQIALLVIFASAGAAPGFATWSGIAVMPVLMTGLLGFLIRTANTSRAALLHFSPRPSLTVGQMSP